MQETVLDGYLSEAELAKQLNVHPYTLKHWKHRGEGPPITRIGQRPYYKITSVQAWLTSCEKPMPRNGRRNNGERRTATA